MGAVARAAFVAIASLLVKVGSAYGEERPAGEAGSTQRPVPKRHTSFDGWKQKKWGALLHIGQQTPVGIGMTGEWTPIEVLGVEAGFGVINDSNLRGRSYRVAGMGRLRFPLGAIALGFGLGLSFGRDEHNLGAQSGILANDASIGGYPLVARVRERALRRDHEVSIELRPPSGLHLRLYTGWRTIITSGESRCEGGVVGSDPPACNFGNTASYTGFAAGHFF